MQVSSLPTESEIYNQKNIQIEQTCIMMNIHGPPDMDNKANQEESITDINQTQETLVVNKNINQLSLEKVEVNIHNYPLTENRNISPAPLMFEKMAIIFNSVNPNANYVNQGTIINNQDIQQKMENNAINIPTINNINNINPPYEEETKEEDKSNKICYCILMIILILVLLPLFVLYFCIMLFCCSEKEERDSDCFSCCFYIICPKRRRI